MKKGKKNNWIWQGKGIPEESVSFSKKPLGEGKV